MAYVEAEEMKDDEDRAEFYEENVGRADQGPVATGSDMMLYPYLVTTYAEVFEHQRHRRESQIL